ncbi:hypothetical protein F5883DRAFT_210193 [Diaporthe sp. PMI_573]|nr:hypothetical protein F5883DRAFT_210193 [Diaporthaceae sp. PMI_573]
MPRSYTDTIVHVLIMRTHVFPDIAESLISTTFIDYASLLLRRILALRLRPPAGRLGGADVWHGVREPKWEAEQRHLRLTMQRRRPQQQPHQPGQPLWPRRPPHPAEPPHPPRGRRLSRRCHLGLQPPSAITSAPLSRRRPGQQVPGPLRPHLSRRHTALHGHQQRLRHPRQPRPPAATGGRPRVRWHRGPEQRQHVPQRSGTRPGRRQCRVRRWHESPARLWPPFSWCEPRRSGQPEQVQLSVMQRPLVTSEPVEADAGRKTVAHTSLDIDRPLRRFTDSCSLSFLTLLTLSSLW